ncbi:hypothetical protein WMF31_11785 [Sorangium sp. So ce1036]|uniref:hypothetical protein n=1 Tax=Sorangium sp. So ce1036 TaxID=3133328 RepID=UPI003F0F3E33
MTEPRRLLEESDSQLERALLNAGVSYRVAPETRAKTLAALGIAGAATLSAAGLAAPPAISAVQTAASSTAVTATFGWTKVLVALSTVGALAGIPAGYLAWRAHHAPPPAALERFTDALAGPISRATPRPPPPVPEAVQPEAPAAPAPAERSAGRASTAARSGAKPSSASAALQTELKALDAARASLASGNAQGALAHLDAYGRAHPRGLLRLEAEVLRIDALARSGRREAATQRAEAFLRRHPNSVLASRVRRYINN